MRRAVAREQDAEEANPIEVDRVRRFLLYCLCVDYRHAVQHQVSAEDTQHFFNLNRTINYLKPRFLPRAPRDAQGLLLRDL